MSLADPSLEGLKTFVSDAQHLRWFSLSALVVMLWDHIIYLDKEIELVWKRPWTRFTALYMMIRYGAAVTAGIYILGIVYPKPSDAFCRFWIMFAGYSGSFRVAAVQLVLAARIWGLYRKSKHMSYILAGALSASVVGMLIVWSLHAPLLLTYTAKVADIDFYICHETQPAPYLWISRIFPLAYDFLVCFFAICKGYRTYRVLLDLKMPLMVIIVRDSVIYFIAISIVEFGAVLMWLTSGGKGVIIRAPKVYAAVLPVVMCCHLMRNLREGVFKPFPMSTTQGAELSEWSSRFPEPPLDSGSDSMGRPRFSEVT